MDLEKTLVICNFIHPFYGNIPFIRSHFRFPSIAFYGDERFPASEEVIRYNQSEGRAEKFRPFGGGFHAYRCVLDAVARFPDHDGYLFVMDDVLLFPRRLRQIDGGRIYAGTGPTLRQDIWGPVPPGIWIWWSAPGGVEACQKAMPEIPERYLSALEAATGSRQVVIGAASDVFYLPKSAVPAFAELFSIFSRHRVFLEIAVPTGLAMLGASLDAGRVRYLWNRHRWLWPLFALFDRAIGIHPVKMSSRWVRALLKFSRP